MDEKGSDCPFGSKGFAVGDGSTNDQNDMLNKVEQITLTINESMEDLLHKHVPNAPIAQLVSLPMNFYQKHREMDEKILFIVANSQSQKLCYCLGEPALQNKTDMLRSVAGVVDDFKANCIVVACEMTLVESKGPNGEPAYGCIVGLNKQPGALDGFMIQVQYYRYGEVQELSLIWTINKDGGNLSMSGPFVIKNVTGHRPENGQYINNFGLLLPEPDEDTPNTGDESQGDNDEEPG